MTEADAFGVSSVDIRAHAPRSGTVTVMEQDQQQGTSVVSRRDADADLTLVGVESACNQVSIFSTSEIRYPQIRAGGRAVSGRRDVVRTSTSRP